MKKTIVILVSLLFLTISCKKEDPEGDNLVISNIATLDVTEVTATTAISGGDIIDDGGTEITQKGVCWSTTTVPTIYDSSTNDGNNSGDFSSHVTGLSNNTTYYLRAYATNSKGTAYGNEVTFKTQNVFSGETVIITGGSFQMGGIEEDEQPIHNVTVSSFKMSKYEITNLQFIDFMNEISVNANGSYLGVSYIYMVDNEFIEYNHDHFIIKSHEKYPVTKVSWAGAKAYSEYYGGRLPTEAEWEFAARGGNNSDGYLYSGSDTIDDIAWYFNNSGNEHHDVGTKAPNKLGIYDITGNVFEWCSDWYETSYYSVSSSNNPQGPSSGADRVIRGGSYATSDNNSRVASRHYGTPNYHVNYLIGFRPAFDN